MSEKKKSGVETRNAVGVLTGAASRVVRTARNLLACALIVAPFLPAVGCMSPYARRLDSVRRDFYEYGDVDRARENLEKGQKHASQKEQDVYDLNAASLELAAGNIDEAKRKLLSARDNFDAIEEQLVKKAGENLLQYWTDDNMVSYEGEDYEKVMIRVHLAIADLLGSGQDARAYAHQIAALQDEIVSRGAIDDPRDSGKKLNPKTAYPRVPIGPYIEGLLWEETYTDSSEAARSYAKVAQWRPQFKQGKEDLVRAQTSVHSRPGYGRLYVFAFVGRGPRKEQVNAEVTQFAMLVADQIFSATNKYSVPPTLAPVPIPALVVEEPYVDGVALDVDGDRVGQTETLADVNEMAIKQYEATKDQLIARAVVRRVVKKGTVYAAKEIGQVSPWVSLAADVGGVVWEAAETADTRCWGLLPAKIQVLSVELPAGEHQITFSPCDRNGRNLGATLTRSVRVDANRNAYTLVNYPDREPIGRVVSSDDAR